MKVSKISDFVVVFNEMQPKVKVIKFDQKAKTWTLEIKKYGNSKPRN